MKKLYTLLLAVLVTACVFAQAPSKMTYQAVIRNAGNNLITNQSIGMRISILQGSVSGTEVYKEIYNPNPQTNANGLVTLEIGSGISLTGTFSTINWGNGNYYIKTETDPTGGTNYTITGTSQLLSVPYALHAKTAETVSGGITETDPIFGTSSAKGIVSPDIANWNTAYGWGNHAVAGYLKSYTETDPIWTSASAKYYSKINMQTSGEALLHFNNIANKPTTLAGYGITDADGSSTNEIQVLSLVESDLTLSKGGGTVILPSYNGDNWGTQSVSTDATLTGNGTTTTPLIIAQQGATTGQVLKWSGTSWLPGTDLSVGSGWSLTGNAGTSAANNFIGTTDNVPLTFKTNNQLSGKIDHSLFNTSLGYLALGSSKSGQWNTAIGDQALYSNTTGDHNTAVGTQVLYLNTTGNNNSAIGYAALNFNTTGYNNTASGYAALYSNTTGSENTADGRDALGFNTTGQQNTATGYQAILYNTEGRANTANGYQALYSNTKGYSNVAIGACALYKNQLGYNLVAIGDSALFNNVGRNIILMHNGFIDGMYNTAVGSKAMFSNITGNYNTAHGYQSLYSNTTGDYNTTNGYQTLFSNTTGNDNTAYGNRALYSNTTGDGNTATGPKSLYSNTTGGGNIATGNGALYSNTSGSGNIATGSGALYSNTSGSENIAVGAAALGQNTTGWENVAISDVALNNNTVGGGNIAVGFHALEANTTGNSNIAIGYAADVTSGNFENAIVIGSGARVDASNKVRIGNTNVTVIEGRVAFTSASDERLKKNIKDLSNGLDFITKLRPVEYQLKKGDGKINYGFIAQDIEKLVGTTNSILTINGDAERTLGLRYTDFIAPLVKAIQEQQEIIQEQKNALLEQQKDIQAQHKQINELKVLVNTLIAKQTTQ